MKISGNTVLITGGNSGIGRALAEALQAEGNEIIVTGRKRATLDDTLAANPRMSGYRLDVSDAGAIRLFASQVVKDHPALNVVINNAGIMHVEQLDGETVDLAGAEATIATNLLGPIRLTAALLPHLRAQPHATIVNVSSGLAFVPLAMTPTYGATKSAIHSYTSALRHQLRNTAVQVIELAPPLVATDLTPGQSADPRAMPLDEFVRETISLLKAKPDAHEILVERVHPLRTAESSGQYGAIFKMLNPA